MFEISAMIGAIKASCRGPLEHLGDSLKLNPRFKPTSPDRIRNRFNGL